MTGTRLAGEIREHLAAYERALRKEYGGDKADDVVREAMFELGEFLDWLEGEGVAGRTE